MLGWVTPLTQVLIPRHSKCHPSWEQAETKPQSTITIWGQQKGHHLRRWTEEVDMRG